MEAPILLNILWLVPIGTWFFSRGISSQYRSAIRGASFGLVVSPASLGLYSFYFVGPLAALFGILGLVLTLSHGFVGYNIAVALGFVAGGKVIQGANSISVFLINGLFWGIVYAVIAHAWYRFRAKQP